MLMYYDLVKFIKLGGSGRVGRLMYKEIMDFLGPLLETVSIKANVAYRQFGEWSLQGSRLDVICARFGNGSLFFLDIQLSPHF